MCSLCNIPWKLSLKKMPKEIIDDSENFLTSTHHELNEYVHQLAEDLIRAKLNAVSKMDGRRVSLKCHSSCISVHISTQGVSTVMYLRMAMVWVIPAAIWLAQLELRTCASSRQLPSLHWLINGVEASHSALKHHAGSSQELHRYIGKGPWPGDEKRVRK